MFWGVCPKDKWGVLTYIPGRGCCVPAKLHVKGKLACCRKDANWPKNPVVKHGNKYSIACGGKLHPPSEPDTDSNAAIDTGGGGGGAGDGSSIFGEDGLGGMFSEGIPSWVWLVGGGIILVSLLKKKGGNSTAK